MTDSSHAFGMTAWGCTGLCGGGLCNDLQWQRRPSVSLRFIKTWIPPGADISDPGNPAEFEIAGEAGSQSSPDISGNIVVWQDNRSGNWDIYGFNLLTRKEFPIINNTANALTG